MTRTPRLLSTFAAALGLCLLAAPARAQEGEPPPSPPSSAPAPGGGAPSGPANSTDESQDSGLGLEWVYINADVGVHYVNMASFSESQLGLVQNSGTGLTWGVGAGVRLFFLSAGVRARNTLLDQPGSLWTIDLEAALHMRIWHIDPYIGVRGGYAFVGSFSSNSVSSAAGMSQPDVSIHGFDVGPTLGIDIYFNSLVSIGAEADAQFLFLQRPKPPLPAPFTDPSQLPAAVQPIYENSGSSVGFGGALTAHLGIHF